MSIRDRNDQKGAVLQGGGALRTENEARDELAKVGKLVYDRRLTFGNGAICPQGWTMNICS